MFDTQRAGRTAFWREGEGGHPLLLLHGWPETKRIWQRNVAPLAQAGFEVIVPDLRGFGDSDAASDGLYDMAASAHDLHTLVHDELGHEHCVVAGGDYGGVVAYDMSLRFEGFVERMVLFNTVPPILGDDAPPIGSETRQTGDYFVRQGRDAEGLAAELDTPDKRRRWVAGMYGHRLWAAPGSFSAEDVDFHTEPFAGAEVFRSSIGLYESALGMRELSQAPRFFEPNPTPTLLLYGPEDHVIPSDFPERMASALPEVVGPFVVPGAGHFLQWERAELFNRATRYFCLDLLQDSGA